MLHVHRWQAFRTNACSCCTHARTIQKKSREQKEPTDLVFNCFDRVNMWQLHMYIYSKNWRRKLATVKLCKARLNFIAWSTTQRQAWLVITHVQTVSGTARAHPHKKSNIPLIPYRTMARSLKTLITFSITYFETVAKKFALSTSRFNMNDIMHDETDKGHVGMAHHGDVPRDGFLHVAPGFSPLGLSPCRITIN